MNAILETLLLCKVRIPFAELDVGDVGVDLFIPADRQAVERMIVAIGGQLFPLEVSLGFANRLKVLFCASQHRLEIFVILSGKRFGCQYDLVF